MTDITKSDSEILVNASSLRDKALRDYKENYKGINRLKHTPQSIFNYYYYGKIAFTIFLEAVEEYHDQESILIEIDGKDQILPGRLVLEDLDRVVYPLAITAWLTIDDWRLHNYLEEQKDKIPTDLSYGLVLEYPIPTIRMAIQMLEPHSSLAMAIDKDLHEEGKERAFEEVRKTFGYSKDYMQEKLVPKQIELES